MYKIIIYFLIFCMMSFSYGESINKQIEAMKSAAPQKRVEMMNRLKVQIAAMNEDERMQAINVLQKSKGIHKTNIQGRMHQLNINKGRSSIQQLKGQNNTTSGLKRDGKK